jgi:hypothetical protein
VVCLEPMKTLAAIVLLIVGSLTAAAGEYSYANRHPIVFPGPHGGIVHISPFPAGKQAASVWASDACWRDCSSDGAWRLANCLTTTSLDRCRPQLDAGDRACLRQCRVSGGPLLNITDY